MRLFIIRHGDAEDRSHAQEDSERSLTAHGKEETRAVARQLVKYGVTCERIIASPLVRAHQTAVILRDAGLSGILEESSDLAPGGHLGTLLENLNEWRKNRNTDLPSNIAWVGHEPDLSTTAEMLIWGKSPGKLNLKKAGIIGLKLPESGNFQGNCELFLMTSPKYFI